MINYGYTDKNMLKFKIKEMLLAQDKKQPKVL